MSCEAYSNGYVQQNKNLFSISSIFGKPLTPVHLKNEQIRDCFYVCLYVEKVVTLDAGI